MATAIPLKSPHFFKPILPGFNNRIKIPPSFINHLDGEMYSEDHAVLRRGGKKWQLKVTNQCLENGWRKFAQENGLEIGDFVVFRHEGNMVFEVLVFDTTKNFHILLRKMLLQLKQKGRLWQIVLSNSHLMVNRAVLEPAHPHFISSLKPFNLKYRRIHLPMAFARENGLSSRRCQMILKDQRKRKWKLQLGYFGSNVYIGRGWFECQTANGLKIGDRFALELISNKKKPIMKIRGKFLSTHLSFYRQKVSLACLLM
ncbi:unnamed protein product [Coffea canephora]|uniref:TF-B3 domain-containing protein n=1 Tax=Coffea canephora TaxID=49390 RepID=A0A068V1D6_COFCA|nr:unnamed protein product [Coffea canephora]